MSFAAPITVARTSTVILLFLAVLLIAPPSAHAASGTTQLTIRLTLPEPSPHLAPMSEGFDQQAVDQVSLRLLTVLDKAPKYAPATRKPSRRDVVVWSHGTGWVLNSHDRAAMIATPGGVVSL